MKEIKPFRSYDEAIKSLDNGGHFYNVFTKAKDETISSAELRKAAGVFSSKQSMILYLELSLSALSALNREHVINHLSEELTDIYNQYKPVILSSFQDIRLPDTSKTVLVKGTAKLVDSKTEFKGFIMVPVMINNITTFTTVPIIDSYNVYEFIGQNSESKMMIAHAKCGNILPDSKILCGGFLKELQKEESNDGEKESFLEVVYFSKC